MGVALSMFFYVLEEGKKQAVAGLSFDALGSFFFSAVSTGCPVCGAFLLPAFGIAASLAALPFGGLEVKFLSLLVLSYAIFEYSKSIAGVCQVPKTKLLFFGKKAFKININKKTLPQAKPLLVLVVFVFVIYYLPKLPVAWRVSFNQVPAAAQATNQAGTDQSEVDAGELFNQINPPEGFELKAVYGDLGPKMIEFGVIDLEKFKEVYQNASQPLTEEQLEILTKGSNKTIKISPENSYFLLNFFWAVGLANNNKILTEGDMATYGGGGQEGNFASTGGWSLAKTEAMNYYAKAELIKLTSQQQQLVEQVSANIYRPCCGNSTAFPDCNHGLALLGVLELMASQGASETEMFEASKYFNAFWFPQSYYDLALFFKAKEGKDFKDIDNRVLLGRDFSSVSGWQNAKNWLTQNGILAEPPKTGGGCGV